MTGFTRRAAAGGTASLDAVDAVGFGDMDVVVDESSLRPRVTPAGRSYVIDVLADAAGRSSFGPAETPVVTQPSGPS